MRQLVDGLLDLEDRLRLGGGPKKIEKQHRDGKLTARERIAQLADAGTMFLEIGLLIAYDQYEGQAPSAGVVTGIAKIEGRPAVIVANDATVKAGAWWPETITKILRAQEIAMRNRLPIVYLVDSAGVNLPYQDGIFPGQYGAARTENHRGRRRDVLEFVGHDIDVGCEQLQRLDIGVFGAGRVLHHVEGRRIRIGGEYLAAQSKPRRRSRQHPAQLSAAENSNGVARLQLHLLRSRHADSSGRSATASVCCLRHAARRPARASSFKASTLAASSAALMAPALPMARVPTGIPAGI